jgi:hypothetical protein
LRGIATVRTPRACRSRSSAGLAVAAVGGDRAPRAPGGSAPRSAPCARSWPTAHPVPAAGSPYPPAESPPGGPAAVAQHRGGLQRPFRHPRELTGSPGGSPGWLPSTAGFPRVPSLLAISRDPPGRRPLAACHRGAGRPAAACTRRAVRTNSPAVLASNPESVRVGHVRRDHRRVHPHPGLCAATCSRQLGVLRPLPYPHWLLVQHAGLRCPCQVTRLPPAL